MRWEHDRYDNDFHQTVRTALVNHRRVGLSEGCVDTYGAVLQSTWCVINGGHYKVLHTAPDRMALRCVACGHTSPGWEVGIAASCAHDACRSGTAARPGA